MALKKRKHPKFNVPNYGTKKRGRVKERWRKQRGIDSKKRVKKNFAGAEPTIGYGNPAEIRGVRASGKRLLMVQNVNDMKNALMMPDIANFDIMIAHAVSRRKRVLMMEIAKKGNVHVTNGIRKQGSMQQKQTRTEMAGNAPGATPTAAAPDKKIEPHAQGQEAKKEPVKK